MNKYVFRNAMEKHFTFVTRSPASVEASHVSGTVNEVISRPGLLVLVKCWVGFKFCMLFVVRTSSSSLSTKPKGNKQGTRSVSNYTIVLV